MAVLNHPNTTPPDGFKFTVRQTGARLSADTLMELVDVVIQHHQWKGIEPTDRTAVSLEIQRQICLGQFPGVCAPELGEDYRPFVDKSRSLDPDKVVEFSKAAYRFVESGGQMVSKAESERRAAICRGCVFNKNSACVCTPLFKILDALVPKSRREPGLMICGLCGCALSVKALLPMETIRSDPASNNLRYPSWCWQKD